MARVPGRARRFGRGLLTLVVLLLAAVGGWLFSLRDEFAGTDLRGYDGAVLALWGGIALVLLGIVIQVVRGWRQDLAGDRGDLETADLRIAMKDALRPLIGLISRMPDLRGELRVAQLTAVSDNAALALAKLLMSHVERARASVYALDPDGGALRVVAYGGRGERPGEFVRGGSASDPAIDRVRAGETLVVDDWRSDPPAGFSKTESDWRSFVAVPIVSGDGYAYGMLTVDSPRPRSFGDTEQYTVAVVADLLAVAFAIAYPAAERADRGDRTDRADRSPRRGRGAASARSGVGGAGTL